MNQKDTDAPTERSLFTRIVEGVITFAVCCYLVRLGVNWLISVRIPLIVIAVIVGIGIITYRLWRWRQDRDNY